MATIAAFYFHDAATSNSGTMPTNSPATQAGGVLGTGTEATGASTARSADDVLGVANPDTKSVITAAANQTAQRLGHRRFCSTPLAAQQLPTTGNWAHRWSGLESNTNHNGRLWIAKYAWRPGTGAIVGSAQLNLIQALSATTETDSTVGNAVWTTAPLIQDGDILVFDIYSEFTQGMSSAYTDSFCYDGTTEGSTTTAASYCKPPVALTLFTAAAEVIPDLVMAPLHNH